MENDLVVYDVKPLRAVDVRAQVNLIQEVMKSVMQKDQHYGVIPGAGNKPTLFKAGAEKIMSTFRLAADPEVEDMSTELVIRYRVKCKLISAAGTFVGAGLGECSSAEEKYAWRGIVSEDEWNATDEADRRTKFRRDGKVKQVRTNPYDLSNTILKMAKKRALVDAVLTVTGASDIFTQDIEDMPTEVLNQKPPVAMPQEKKQEGQAAPKGHAISEAQRKRFYAIGKSTGATDEQLKDWLFREFGFESSKDITSDVYEDICNRVVNELVKM
jgi:hypothetical protein